jgi:hypothetical protein
MHIQQDADDKGVSVSVLNRNFKRLIGEKVLSSIN